MITPRALLLIFSLFIGAFEGIAQQEGEETNDFFSEESFYKDTLFIRTTFIECGEWGGHLEVSKVYLQGKDFYIRYEKYSANCNTIAENNGVPKQLLQTSTTKRLLDQEKSIIRKYLHSLMDVKIVENPVFHVGYVFEVSNMDKSMKIFAYTLNPKAIQSYSKLVSSIWK
jgi:hypothetical protein